MTAGLKRCHIVYARPGEQITIAVESAPGATVGDILAAAQSASPRTDIPWSTDSIGIFGERCTRLHKPVDGDRIELYRPLIRDPRRARQETAERAKREARRRSGS